MRASGIALVAGCIEIMMIKTGRRSSFTWPHLIIQKAEAKKAKNY
jgi:hypothetical protein